MYQISAICIKFRRTTFVCNSFSFDLFANPGRTAFRELTSPAVDWKDLYMTGKDRVFQKAK